MSFVHTAPPVLEPSPETAILAGDDPRYAAFVAGHPHASLFTSPDWIAVIERAYGFRVEVSALFGEDGRLAAALPFCRLEDPRGRRVAALPFSDYADPLMADPAHWPALVAPLLEAGAPVRLRLLHNTAALADSRFAATAEAFWHAVDLERPEAAILASLEGSARRNIRKAERAGVEVRCGHGLEDVRLFHRMHAHLRKTKYRMLAQPRAFFEAIHDRFSQEMEAGDGGASDGRLAVLTAWHEGAPLAGILLLEWGDTLYYKFNASFETSLRPNDLLLWHALRHGRARGLKRLDFGISDGDQPGLLRYKRKFATHEKPIHLLARQPAPAVAPGAAEAGAMLGRITQLLTDPALPDAVAEEAGDALYRYFA